MLAASYEVTVYSPKPYTPQQLAPLLSSMKASAIKVWSVTSTPPGTTIVYVMTIYPHNRSISLKNTLVMGDMRFDLMGLRHLGRQPPFTRWDAKSGKAVYP